MHIWSQKPSKRQNEFSDQLKNPKTDKSEKESRRLKHYPSLRMPSFSNGIIPFWPIVFHPELQHTA